MCYIPVLLVMGLDFSECGGSLRRAPISQELMGADAIDVIDGAEAALIEAPLLGGIDRSPRLSFFGAIPLKVVSQIDLDYS